MQIDRGETVMNKEDNLFYVTLLLSIVFLFVCGLYMNRQDEIDELRKENKILKHQCDSLQVGIDATSYLIKIGLDSLASKTDMIKVYMYGDK